MGAKLFALIAVIVLALSLAGCATQAEPPRIALLAPFEGRNRDLGYNALYAARLALSESGANVELFPIDDGGFPATAVDRIRALANDQLTQVVILLGENATSADVQQALADLPAIIIGTTSETSAHSFVYSSELQPDPAFTARYLASDQFAPTPNNLAMPIYNAIKIAADAAQTRNRTDSYQYLQANLSD